MTQLRGYMMMHFSWMLLQLYKKGNFTLEASQMKKHYLKRMDKQAIVLKKALAEADVIYYKCNLLKNQEGESYLKLPNSFKPKMSQYTSGNIVVGAGYSSDSQQVVPQICFNATVSSISAPTGYIQLDTAISFTELQNKLGISVSISGSYGMFSAEAKAGYIRSVKDSDYSMSLNYFEYVTNNVAVQIAGDGDSALTESGKEFYKGGNNSYFGLLCGDQYISSYQQGALLAMGLNIVFNSSTAKEVFEEKAGATFGHIINAAERVQSVVRNYKMTGSIIIQAFQMGGDPSQLSEIINKDSTGHYYALTCSLIDMSSCVKTASGLLDYAKNNFSKQFSFKNNTGLAPLGIAFTQYNPIEHIGLTAPTSLVTPEVEKYRYDLSRRLKENEYYQQKLYPFFNKGYPVELDTAFINEANSVMFKANGNIGVLVQEHDGAVDCFNLPDKCKTIKARIDSQLQNFTIDDLKFLEDIKYTITTKGGMFYNTGSGKLWYAVPDDKPGKEMLSKVMNFTITEDEYSYDTVVRIPQAPGKYEFVYNGKSTNSSMRYIGIICYKNESETDCKPESKKYYIESKLISPFFFSAFSVTE